MFENEELAGVAERGNVGILLLDIAQIDVALGQLGHGDFAQTFESRGVLGGKTQVAVLFDFQFGFGALEVETVGQFAPGLVHGIEDFLTVEFGDDVEGGHDRDWFVGAHGFEP